MNRDNKSYLLGYLKASKDITAMLLRKYRENKKVLLIDVDIPTELALLIRQAEKETGLSTELLEEKKEGSV